MAEDGRPCWLAEAPKEFLVVSRQDLLSVVEHWFQHEGKVNDHWPLFIQRQEFVFCGRENARAQNTNQERGALTSQISLFCPLARQFSLVVE